ncbi:MAG TPA: M15 family metallopeptidase [Nocardioidaceae bacterium]|nr:M15 family metallopeptidase [Nocardioidaceae bacterium]
MSRSPVLAAVAIVATAALGLGVPATADAAETAGAPTPTVLTLTARDRAFVATDTRLTVRLADVAGNAVAGAAVRVQRRVNGGWRFAQRLTTNGNGVARTDVRVRTVGDGNRFRAVWDGHTGDDGTDYAGDTSAAEAITGRRIATSLRLGGPGRVVDERRVSLTVTWHAVDGRPITQRVRLYRKNAGQRRWQHVRTPLVRDGRAALRVRPRVDSRWRVAGDFTRWHTRARSAVHRVDNVPPGSPVVLPSAAPDPAIRLRPQARAAGAGLDAAVRRIPHRMWREMVGRSWHRGCPVGRGSLRLVRMNYWGFDGYRHRGEIVVHRRITGPTVGVFRDLYRGRFPVRAMHRVDRFGWSARLRGANDYRSMKADNTSGFNCRRVVGNPGAVSPHSYGTAIDINPWENPYVSRRGVVPNRWWLHRSHPRVAWRSYSHPVVRAFTRHGFSWGGAYSDFHHFED